MLLTADSQRRRTAVSGAEFHFLTAFFSFNGELLKLACRRHDGLAYNGKYMPTNITGEYAISESEDISTQMSLYNKRYEAAYYQMSEADQDTTGMQEWLLI